MGLLNLSAAALLAGIPFRRPRPSAHDIDVPPSLCEISAIPPPTNSTHSHSEIKISYRFLTQSLTP